VDHLFTGKVEKVDTELFQTLLTQGIIPVVPPLGFDGDGKTYRVNSDHMAVSVAEALKAAKLIFITSTDGLLAQGQLIRQILASDLESILATKKQDILPEMMSKAIHSAAACKAGIPRVHIINGRVDEGLLAEVFSNEGIGTLIYANEYQQIRRALKKDVRAIMLLTKNAVATDELVKRTRANIEKQLQDYYIFEIDKNPVACVALHIYTEQRKGELACLYVSPSHENQGIGRKLNQFVENKARELGLQELIVLSTQAFTYFQSKGGFVEGTPDDLPPSRREKYDLSGRNSKVLIKKLSTKTPDTTPAFLKG
jgi:amino-acid N-acetyltransferase